MPVLTCPQIAGFELSTEVHRGAEAAQGDHALRVHRPDGSQIKSFKKRWAKACEDAGHRRLLHDFRRTAVRNLERAGVPRTTAMKMVGHKTESIYRRYAIQDEAMLREAAAKLDAWTTDQRANAKVERNGQVKRFRGRRRASSPLETKSLGEIPDL